MPEPISKLNAADAAPGPSGQALHIGTADMALRTWREGPVDKTDEHASDHETLGYVIDGEAELISGDTVLHLTSGDSWRVPKGTMHRYRIAESFHAVEVTAPPARGAPLGGHSAG